MISDVKHRELDPSGTVVYTANVLQVTDGYPFGWEIKERSFSTDSYRFGFNGKENDSEYGEQLIQDYGFRLYNPAIGKFLSVDPLAPEYPFYTPYQFAGNKPIRFIDRDGAEEFDAFAAIYHSSEGNLQLIGTAEVSYEVGANAKLLLNVGGASLYMEFNPNTGLGLAVFTSGRGNKGYMGYTNINSVFFDQEKGTFNLGKTNLQEVTIKNRNAFKFDYNRWGNYIESNIPPPDELPPFWSKELDTKITSVPDNLKAIDWLNESNIVDVIGEISTNSSFSRTEVRDIMSVLDALGLITFVLDKEVEASTENLPDGSVRVTHTTNFRLGFNIPEQKVGNIIFKTAAELELPVSEKEVDNEGE